MERKLRTCAVCRNQYKFCNKCREDADKPLWYFSFCCENCKEIYNVTSDFESCEINANEAKSELDKLDLSKFDNFGESYKKSIEKIIGSSSIPANIEEIADITFSEEYTEVVSEENDETIENIVEEEKVFKKSKNKRARYDIEE